MSIPTLTNNIPQPNMIINPVQIPHAIIPSVNANNGIPIATALAHAPTVDQGDEIKTGIVVGTIPIAGTSIVGVQAVPVQNTSPVKVIQAQATSSEYIEVLPKSRLEDLVRDTDPNLNLEDEVEELILNYVDKFVDRVLRGASLIAKHRQAKTMEVKDVQQFLNRNYNIWSSGFGTDELKPYKRNQTTDPHKQRLALIRKALKNN